MREKGTVEESACFEMLGAAYQLLLDCRHVFGVEENDGGTEEVFAPTPNAR